MAHTPHWVTSATNNGGKLNCQETKKIRNAENTESAESAEKKYRRKRFTVSLLSSLCVLCVLRALCVMYFLGGYSSAALAVGS